MRERLMTKEEEKEIVEIAEGEIEKFVEEWKRDPYLWDTETDVHGELYIRIKSSLHRKFHPKEGRYEDMAEKELFDCIYCKPKTDIVIRGTNETRYPDIVIYKGELKNKGNEPMLWACEIKYRTKWSGTFPEGSVKKDIETLEGLLEQRSSGTGTDYACYLILQRMKKNKNKRSHIRVLKKPQFVKGIEKILKNRDMKIKLYSYSIEYEKRRT